MDRDATNWGYDGMREDTIIKTSAKGMEGEHNEESVEC